MGSGASVLRVARLGYAHAKRRSRRDGTAWAMKRPLMREDLNALQTSVPGG